MADNKIRLRIVTPARVLFDDTVDMLIMRSTSGDIGIMYGHQPITTTLGYGKLRIINSDDEKTALVFGGFANIQPESVTLLSDAAEWPEDIDVERAEKSKQRAESRIKSDDKNINLIRAELSLKRSLIRLGKDI